MNFKTFLCRCCLFVLKEKKVFNIFETEDLAKKLMLCSALPVEAMDEYPINVCSECYELVEKFYEFQQMCCKSLEKYNELINSEEETAASSGDNLIKDMGDEYSSNNTEDVLEIVTKKNKRGRPHKKKLEVSKRQPEQLVPNILPATEDQPAVNSECEIECKTISANNTPNNPLREAMNLRSLEDNLEINTEEHNLTNLNYIIIEEKTLFEPDSRDSSQESQLEENPLHQCDRCDAGFVSTELLLAHKKRHDGLPPYICPQEGCCRSFNRWHYFYKHKKKHCTKQEHMHKCEEDNCGRVYKNKCALNLHKRRCHNIGPKLKTHMCEICGKIFKSAKMLSDHRYTHIDKNQLPYVCEEKGCLKRYSTKGKLRVHKMRHAGIKNFICPYCDMRKTTRNELKIHINYHTLERTWPCRYCTKIFNSAGNLKMHVKNIHERAKDFKCRFCERSFGKADTRKYHEMTHTGEKPHECELCGRRFVQPAALRTHRKVHLRQKTILVKIDMPVETEQQEDAKNATDIEETTVITEAMMQQVLSDNNTNLN